MTIQQVMNISRESLNNYQMALAVVSQNLANMNVEGYVKLRADFETNPCYNFADNVPSIIKGLNGASIGSLTSYIDTAASQNAREANSEVQYYNTLGGLVGMLDDIANELTGSGLQACFSDFFSAAQNLSAYPTDLSARQLYLQSAQNVADKFNSIAKELDSLQVGLVGNYKEPATIQGSELQLNTDAFNQALAQVADLNKQILYVGGGDSANTLKNERELVLSDLSNFMNLKVTYKDDGTVDIFSGNINLVKGAVHSAKLEAATGDADTPGVIKVYNLNDELLSLNANDQISGGKIGAILSAVNKSEDGFITVSSMLDDLNYMAGNFAKEVNRLQLETIDGLTPMALGVDADGNDILVDSKEPIFDTTNPITAATIKVNPKVINDPTKVAAARVDKTAADYEFNVGNADNMVAISQLRDKKTMSSIDRNDPTKNNLTFEGYLTYYSTNVGTQQKTVASKYDTAKAKSDSAQSTLKSLTGVNLDEELSDMIKFQRAYEASARLFNTANEIYKVLINLGA